MHALSYSTLRLPHFSALQKYNLHGFSPKVDLEFERGDYVVRTARNEAELNRALVLRHTVFYQEILGARGAGVDVDEFDFDCDHLIILDKKSRQVVGTYRLNCSLFADQFYSAKEFILEHFMILPGVKLELGRACIDKDFRNGTVLSLLWRGITEYIRMTGSNYLLGCTSVFNENPKEIAKLMHYFYQTKAVENRYLVHPTKKFKMPELMANFLAPESADVDVNLIEPMIPSLLFRYLKFGAKVCPVPAWDEEFRCVDFLTILETSNLQTK